MTTTIEALYAAGDSVKSGDEAAFSVLLRGADGGSDVSVRQLAATLLKAHCAVRLEAASAALIALCEDAELRVRLTAIGALPSLCTAAAGDGAQLRRTTAAVLGAALRLSAAQTKEGRLALTVTTTLARERPAAAVHAALELVDGGGAPAGLAGFLERATARGAFAQLGADERAQLDEALGAAVPRLAEGAERDALSAVQRALATPAPAAPAAAAASPKKPAPALRAPSSSVYVGGLHGSQLEGGPRAAQEALSAELGKWGGVAKVTLKLFAKNTTGYGFVNFSSQKDAEAAVGAYVAGEYVPFDDPKIVLNFGKAPGGSVAEEEEEEDEEEDETRRRRSPRSRRCARRAPRCTWVGCTDRSSTARRRRWRRSSENGATWRRSR